MPARARAAQARPGRPNDKGDTASRPALLQRPSHGAPARMQWSVWKQLPDEARFLGRAPLAATLKHTQLPPCCPCHAPRTRRGPVPRAAPCWRPPPSSHPPTVKLGRPYAPNSFYVANLGALTLVARLTARFLTLGLELQPANPAVGTRARTPHAALTTYPNPCMHYSPPFARISGRDCSARLRANSETRVSARHSAASAAHVAGSRSRSRRTVRPGAGLLTFSHLAPRHRSTLRVVPRPPHPQASTAAEPHFQGTRPLLWTTKLQRCGTKAMRTARSVGGRTLCVLAHHNGNT